ncbi:uncharacterized protein LOC132377731 isoform X2 [Hypanus sabinus]|uniref:uncharacterized protein LOC132377731 isoform X2 n=1 Tax=Hypanus sabinus TaxID=79690 RepID=UPI0028C46FCE|nr:uncharacterized protein LOC132377731 isoform X2 [Hypanus sabinus]
MSTNNEKAPVSLHFKRNMLASEVRNFSYLTTICCDVETSGISFHAVPLKGDRNRKWNVFFREIVLLDSEVESNGLMTSLCEGRGLRAWPTITRTHF